MFVVLFSLLLIVITAQPYYVLVLAVNDDGDDGETDTFQSGDLRTCKYKKEIFKDEL